MQNCRLPRLEPGRGDSVARNEEEQESHDKAVANIAAVRFSFPDNDNPNLRTFTNSNGEQNKGVKSGDEVIYPDIVTVETGNNTAPMLGEVETSISVTDDEGAQWKKYSRACQPFYLYVRESYASEAKRILRSQGIRCAGLRT